MQPLRWTGDDLEFEVEHPLFLARIESGDTGELWRSKEVPKSDLERLVHIQRVIKGEELPIEEERIWSVRVVWLPKYQAINLGPDEKSAYRVLNTYRLVVGKFREGDDAALDKLTEEALKIAEKIPDPAEIGKEGGM